MFKNAMSGANQDTEKFSLCLHIRKFFRVLIHRANAREPVNPEGSLAAPRSQTQQCAQPHRRFNAGGK